MALASLELTAFRNLRSLSLNPTAGVNIIWGKNGLGKTSVLEAIHLLSLGRSFRSRHIDEAIHWQCDRMHLVAHRAGGGRVSLHKGRGQLPRFELNGDKVRTASELSRNLPVELVYADTPALISGTPALRRSFVDRGIFGLQPDFYALRRRYDAAMRQRNRLLRDGVAGARLNPWEHIMGGAGERIAAARESWLGHFSTLLGEVLEQADHPWVQSAAASLKLSLGAGWARSDEPLTEALNRTRERDRQMGYSTLGPHRADLRIELGGRSAGAALSGGQRKLLACLLTLTQGRLLHSRGNIRPLQLFDDLASELDSAAAAAVCRLAQRQGGQILMTSLTEHELDAHWEDPDAVGRFPLEQLAEVA